MRFKGVSLEVQVSIASCGLYPSSQVSLTSSMFAKSSSIRDLLLFWYVSRALMAVRRFSGLGICLLYTILTFVEDSFTFSASWSISLAEIEILAFGSMHFEKLRTLWSLRILF